MSDLLKAARPSIEYFRSMLVRATYSSEPHVKELSYIEIEKALDHYEELLKKEEAVKPTEYYEDYCIRYHCLNCNATVEATSLDKKNMFKPKHCHTCGTKIDWSDT